LKIPAVQSIILKKRYIYIYGEDMKIVLPVGFHEFHKDRFFNLQLNRWYSLGYTRLQDIERAAAGIKNFDDYIHAFVRLAEEAVADRRLENAAFYYRAAEFLVSPSSPDKISLYDRFIDLFYEAFREDNIERHTIAYENGFLPAMRLSPAGNISKGTIVIHGGFDSLIEEFYCFWTFFAGSGYEVIAFEGPGQGGALRKYGLVFDHDWEKPARAVLDHFNLSDVTILGISMGGYWCLRAAAFEKRIKRVISFPPLYDWMESTNGMNRAIVNAMMKWKWLMRKGILMKKRAPLMEFVIDQTLFIIGKEDPLDVARWEMAMNKKHVHSELVDQDVLLLAGEHDLFQPVTLYHKQKAALINARSVTGRIFTKAEHADHHCAIGNIGLALDVMLEWMEEKSKPE
jgi:pimeloyl-ACP methyl ester carboxylesterase